MKSIVKYSLVIAALTIISSSCGSKKVSATENSKEIVSKILKKKSELALIEQKLNKVQNES